MSCVCVLFNEFLKKWNLDFSPLESNLELLLKSSQGENSLSFCQVIKVWAKEIL